MDETINTLSTLCINPKILIFLNFVIAVLLTSKLHEALKQSLNDMEKNLKGLDVSIFKLLITKLVLLIIFTMFTLLTNSNILTNK